MSEQEEEKNTLEGSQNSVKQSKTPIKISKMYQSNPTNNQYAEIEKVVLDRLRKTSSTFSFRDEGIPVVVDDNQIDHSFEKNEITVTPCRSPLNQSDNMHYDASDISIPQGQHNLFNSFIKRNLAANFDNNYQQNPQDEDQQNNVQKTPQLIGKQPSEEQQNTYYNDINLQGSFHNQKLNIKQSDEQVILKNNAKFSLNQEKCQEQTNSSKLTQNNKQNTFQNQNTQNISEIKLKQQDEIQIQNLKVIAEGEQEDDQLQDLKNEGNNLKLQSRRESKEKSNQNYQIKITQNQDFSVNESNKDQDNNYWESSSAIDAFNVQPSSTSFYSQKERDAFKAEEQKEFKENNQSNLLSVNQPHQKFIKNDDNSFLKSLDTKGAQQNNSLPNKNYIAIQQSQDFFFSEQNTPRDQGDQSPQPLQNQNFQRNGEYSNLYQEFLKKQQQQIQDSPVKQEEGVAKFGDYSSLREEESMIGDHSIQNQNNTFISNNMSTILQQLNNPSHNDRGYNSQQNSCNNTNQAKSFTNNYNNQQNINQNTKQPISEFNYGSFSNQSYINNQNSQFKKQNTDNQNHNHNNYVGRYFPSEIIGSREIATTESYLPTPESSNLTSAQNKDYSKFNFKQVQSEMCSNAMDQAFLDNSGNNHKKGNSGSNQLGNFSLGGLGGGIVHSEYQNNSKIFQSQLQNQKNLNDFSGSQNQHSIFADQNHQNMNLVQQMYQNFATMNQGSSYFPGVNLQPSAQLINDLNNSRISNFSQNYAENYSQFHPSLQNNMEVNNGNGDFVHNQQQIEFFNQQHSFVMNIMNFYEFHLNKMKQIALEKNQEIMEKDRIIQDMQAFKTQDQNYNLMQQNIIQAQEEIRVLKQKEKRLELLVDQTRDDYEFKLQDLREEIIQITKIKDQQEIKLKEAQQNLLLEHDKNLQLSTKVQESEQMQEKLKKEKDYLQEELNETIQDLKLELKNKNKKIQDQQNQIDLLLNRVTQLQNTQKQEEQMNYKKNQSSHKKESQLNKSFDDIYYNQIKDSIQEESFKYNNYSNNNQNKDRGQKQQFVDNFNYLGEKGKNDSPSMNYMYDRTQKMQIQNTPPQNNKGKKQEFSYGNDHIHSNNSPYNNNNNNKFNNNNNNNNNEFRNQYQVNHQKKQSDDRNQYANQTITNKNNYFNVENNQNPLQKQNHFRTPSQGERANYLNSNSNSHYQNNNYYQEIYMNYKNENTSQPPMNNYTQSFVSNTSNINSNFNYNKGNYNNSNQSNFEYNQASNERTKQKNNLYNEESFYNYGQNKKPTLTFPSNQNYENNQQQIKQIEQALTQLNQEKQQLETQILKLPIHQKNAQQRLQKHTLEKKLETIEKDISDNRKRIKQLQNC
ncbi:hypothetical protein TTHERM_00537410 (macronuclear) [Tetrahymena thermophila SB210]|uniref:Uncharacterized protein n=1 Tax=Tetrahymena thermophila (strain SB210) TaxID=312017 RepID=I7MHV2_TETTS|nr:hypothetical protein TTHERM_00537410 [Tetrahymena thermophila SB210]EAS03306.2 hypothetical protein TTHERM_00537410 [Tetrahymena thermophila SB210]|eukprot:XP_001023551.2 hypothetical protein TTHERM_00537410 [Tetrahymena thermophila SB210]